MFDFGFSELLIVALVALIVVGPERLPKVARTAGHLLGRLQRYVSDVKSDISREMQLEDLKKLQQQVEQQARDLESSVRTQMQSVESDLGKSAAEIKSELSVDEAPRLTSSGASSEAAAAGNHPGQAGGDSAQSGSAPGEGGVGSGGHEKEPAAGPQLELGLDSSRQAGQTAEKS